MEMIRFPVISWQSPSVVTHDIILIVCVSFMCLYRNPISIWSLDADSILSWIHLPAAEYKTLREVTERIVDTSFAQSCWGRLVQVTNENSSIRKSLYLRGADFFSETKEKKKSIREFFRTVVLLSAIRPKDHGVFCTQNTTDNLVPINVFCFTVLYFRNQMTNIIYNVRFELECGRDLHLRPILI